MTTIQEQDAREQDRHLVGAYGRNLNILAHSPGLSGDIVTAALRLTAREFGTTPEAVYRLVGDTFNPRNRLTVQ
jgi:hypothetical protein